MIDKSKRDFTDIVFHDGTELRALIVDATIEQRHSMTAKATEQPVERGVDVTDHVTPERRTLPLDVMISDTPLDDPGGMQTRCRDAWALLLEARNRALEATITTGLDTYEGMILAKADTRITAADGSWIRMSLEFVEIQKASTELVADPTPNRARSTTDRGSQSTTETTPHLRSVLFRAAAPIAQLFGFGS
jgi:hypothetical protein